MSQLSGCQNDCVKPIEVDPRFTQSRKLEAIGRLAGGVAHDFNNHLTVILGCCQLLLSLHEEGTETRKLVGEVEKAGERAAMLTRQLLAFSRKQTIQLVPLNLNDIVTNLVAMLRRLITENINLTTDLRTPLHNIKADAGQIEQVILNLVVNARDAMRPAGGELRVETREVVIEHPCRQEELGIPPGCYASLVVRDSGCGMDSDVMAHLFEPFFTTKEPGKGTGLGLATVYGIVKQCNGHIRVASKPGVGTRFRIYFPGVEDAVPAEPSARPSRAGAPGKGTILLVEDDQALRRLVSQVLRTSGYRTLDAGQGQEALRLAAEHAGPIDLVLTDVIMPILNGPQLVNRLLPRYPGLKVLYMSGYTDSYLPFDGEQACQATLLQKPFIPSTLLEVVQKVLAAERPGALLIPLEAREATMPRTEPTLEVPGAPTAHASERRVDPRFPILQRCFAWPPGATGAQGWRCIAYNISASGIGLTIDAPLQAGALLEIEAWSLPGAPRLQARVVHRKFVDFLWFCGCELTQPLTEAELESWLAGPLSWLPEGK